MQNTRHNVIAYNAQKYVLAIYSARRLMNDRLQFNGQNIKITES